MSKEYYASVRIGQVEYRGEITCDIKTAYRVACSLARYGKRQQIKTRFIVDDALGNTVIRTYSRYSEANNVWIARHSSMCRYSGYNGMGRYL